MLARQLLIPQINNLLKLLNILYGQTKKILLGTIRVVTGDVRQVDFFEGLLMVTSNPATV